MSKEKTACYARQPIFFEGQSLGPEELNRIPSFTVHRQATYVDVLSGKGGIIRGVGQNCDVIPTANGELNITVLPGAAISESGYLFKLDEERALDVRVLAPVASENAVDRRELFVHLLKREASSDLVADPEFPEIQGYAEKILDFDIKISSKQYLGRDSVLLARIMTTSSTASLVKATPDQSYDQKDGVIDTTLRTYLFPLGGYPMNEAERVDLTEGLKSTQSVFEQICATFHAPEPNDLLPIFYHLLTEVHRTALDDQVVGHLLSQAIPVTASILEQVRELLASKTSVRDERIPILDEVLQSMHDIATRLQTRTDNPIVIIKEFVAIGRDVGHRLLGEAHAKEYLLRFRKAMKKMRHQAFHATSTVAPAGKVFMLRETISPETLDQRGKLDTTNQVKQVLSGRYPSGEKEDIQCVSLPHAKVTLAFEKLQPGKDVLIIGKNYKRRQEVEVRYLWNGKPIYKESTTEDDPNDSLVTYGFLIPGNIIGPSSNELELAIENLEIKYLFLGLYLYQ